MNNEMDFPTFKARIKYLMGDQKPYAWAKMMGFDGGTFDRMWKDEIVPRANHLATIADKYNITIDWLVTGKGPMKRNKSINEEYNIHQSQLKVSDSTEFIVAIEMLTIIYASGNSVLITAIYNNLKAFCDTLNSKNLPIPKVVYKIYKRLTELEMNFEERLAAIESQLLKHKEENHKKGEAA